MEKEEKKMSIKKENETKNNSEKLKKIKGDAYEKLSSYNICKKIYLNDLKDIDKNIYPNATIKIEELRNDIINNLFPNYNIKLNDYTQFIKIQNKIYQCFSLFYQENDFYKKNYDSSVSSEGKKLKSKKVNKEERKKIYMSKQKKKEIKSSEESEIDDQKIKKEIKTSDESQNENKTNDEKTYNINEGKNIESKKNMLQFEMDLVIKDISGDIILKYFQQMNKYNIEYIKSFEIKESQKYNMVFEITISPDDFFDRKIPQLFKYACSLMLLYDTAEIIKDQATYYFNNFIKKYGYIDYDEKTIIICVCNNNIDKFLQLKTIFDNAKNNQLLEQFKVKCQGKFNVNFNYYPFYLYDIESQFESHYKIEEINKQEIKKLNEKLDEKDKEMKQMMLEIIELKKQLEDIKNKK